MQLHGADMKVRVTADTSEAIASLDDIRTHVEALNHALGELKRTIGEEAFAAYVAETFRPLHIALAVDDPA